MRIILEKQVAEQIIRSVLDGFSVEEKATLKANLTAGHELYCGKRSYMVVGPNAGDMITLSLVKNDYPDHTLDFNRSKEINDLSISRYNLIVKEHTLNYYFATQSLDEATFKQLILDYIGDPNAGRSEI